MPSHKFLPLPIRLCPAADMQAMFDNVVHVFKNVPTCAFSKSIEPLVHKTFNDEWFRKELHVKEDLC